MSRKKYEDWTIAALNVASPESEVAQEWAVPRNTRRIDTLHQWNEPPEAFGVLRSRLANRTVLVEHESSTLTERKWWRFWIALAWLSSVWFEAGSLPERKVRERLRRNPAHRYPVLLVLTESLSPSLLRAIPRLSQLDTPGVWADGDPESFTTIVIDRSRLARGAGVGLWHFLLGPSADARYDVLRALREDPTISVQLRTALEEAIMNQTIPTDEPTRIGLAQQIREEGREEGRREGLLRLAATIAPEFLTELQEIAEIDELVARIEAHVKKR
jgi:hypothetical protein